MNSCLSRSKFYTKLFSASNSVCVFNVFCTQHIYGLLYHCRGRCNKIYTLLDYIFLMPRSALILHYVIDWKRSPQFRQFNPPE